MNRAGLMGFGVSMSRLNIRGHCFGDSAGRGGSAECFGYSKGKRFGR